MGLGRMRIRCCNSAGHRGAPVIPPGRAALLLLWYHLSPWDGEGGGDGEAVTSSDASANWQSPGGRRGPKTGRRRGSLRLCSSDVMETRMDSVDNCPLRFGSSAER